MTMQEPDLGLVYSDFLPDEYFEEFRDKVSVFEANVFIDSREHGPQAALEWAGPTAIMVLIGAPFVNAFVKRVADDLADETYPKIKQAVKNLMKKVFSREPVQFVVYATAEEKARNPKMLRFSVYASSKRRRGQPTIKFVFDRDLTEQECEEVAEQMFQTLEHHYASQDADDLLSHEIAALGKSDAREVYLLNSKEQQRWIAVDPAKEVQHIGRSSSETP